MLSFISCVKTSKERRTSNAVENPELWNETERKFLIDELKRTERELIQAIAHLIHKQWTFRENPEGWSIA